MRTLAATSARLSESVAAKADRYFAEQCRRLGPVDADASQPTPRRASTARTRLDRELRRIAAT